MSLVQLSSRYDVLPEKPGARGCRMCEGTGWRWIKDRRGVKYWRLVPCPLHGGKARRRKAVPA